ncbi:MAG: tetratricopeptide repeat protein [Alphaproteobacteria bacterium]|nr:tetratricopeptide repeat protein [Alphaproteobacteria bacterium]
MPIAVLAVLMIQGLCLYHATQTGRQQQWMLILLLLPGIGSAAYFFFEILPDLANTRRGRKAFLDVRTVIDPDREYRERRAQVELSGTPAAKAALAEECARKGMYDDATELYRSALTGHFADDPNLLLGFAKVQLDKGEPAEAQRALDRLREKSPTFQSADGHLLYARTLEGQGKQDQALSEYEAVAAYFPGFEAKVRFALYVLKLGQAQRGREMLEAVAKAYKQLPRHAQDLNRDWYLVAKKNLDG